MMETLPLLTPDPQRGQRTVARCHERLARRRSHRQPVVTRVSAGYLLAERVLVGGLCVVYMSSVALAALQMLGGD